MTIMYDNEALYDICRRNLDIERPTYTNLNRWGSVASRVLMMLIFQSGYGSKLATPIVGHPLVNVYITMEHR